MSEAISDAPLFSRMSLRSCALAVLNGYREGNGEYEGESDIPSQPATDAWQAQLSSTIRRVISQRVTMQVHIFRGEGRIFGFTRDSEGSNLPVKHGPWSAFKTLELMRGQKQPGVNVEECLDDIERHGLHVTDAHARITEQALG